MIYSQRALWIGLSMVVSLVFMWSLFDEPNNRIELIKYATIGYLLRDFLNRAILRSR